MLKQTDSLLQRSGEDLFYKEYVSTSQALEECIMEMLLLPHDSLSVNPHASFDAVQVDVSELLKCVENLEILTLHQSQCKR